MILRTCTSKEDIDEILAAANTIRERSGKVDSTSKLVAFLYLLIRNDVPAGRIEKIIKEVDKIGDHNKALYSNGWLAEYAKDIAKRLT